MKNAILKLNSNGFYFEKELSSVIEKSLATSITPEHKTALLLTDREMQVLHLTLQELNGKETAERMHISPRTVEKHKKNLMIKKMFQDQVTGRVGTYLQIVLNFG